MILLIDNYDSFSYNLYQLAASVEADIKVIRNDGYTVEEIEKMGPAALILSPGSGGHFRGRDMRGSHKEIRGADPYPGSVSGTPGHMRSFWRNGHLCQGVDAR